MSIDRNNLGKEIGEIILVKEYPLILRCDKIRKRVNEKLSGLNLGAISAKVMVNNYDKLEIELSSSRQRISEKVGLAGGMDIITLKERINKAILNINKRLKNMKQRKTSGPLKARRFVITFLRIQALLRERSLLRWNRQKRPREVR